MVGINSDRSVRVLKGPGRPMQGEADRAEAELEDYRHEMADRDYARGALRATAASY